MQALVDLLQMASLAFVSVALWTLRVAMTARGRRIAGSLTAGVEAIVFVVAFSRVVQDLGALERILGYAAGVALGTLAGVILDERLSAGQSELRVVTEGGDLTHVYALQEEGWPVTWVSGRGPNGDVTVAFVAVDDKRLTELVPKLHGLAPEAFWTVERLRTAKTGTHRPEWVQVGQIRGLDVIRRHPRHRPADSRLLSATSDSRA
ncbi:MAG TPA: DUF5698 domain-containing protein [Actinomycetota bacterium]|nr:DUF5698 domain-containing protein [Actinomycetota bacterium]